jgi:hypothetical protein
VGARRGDSTDGSAQSRSDERSKLQGMKRRRENFSFAAPRLADLPFFTHGSRRGLHSSAASRLEVRIVMPLSHSGEPSMSHEQYVVAFLSVGAHPLWQYLREARRTGTLELCGGNESNDDATPASPLL